MHSEYDRLDRLAARHDAGFASEIGRYEYLGAWRVASLTYQNSTRLTHLGGSGTSDVGFDNLRRVVNHRWEKFSGATPLGSGALIVGFEHQDASGNPRYDRANNKLIEHKTHDTDNSELYRYDSVYRLTSTGAGGQGNPQKAFQRGKFQNGNRDAISGGNVFRQDWDLDGLGNWARFDNDNLPPETRAHSDFNEIVSRTGVPAGLFHDKNGNMTDDGERLMKWDGLNRLREVRRKSDNALVASYAYDCHNRRMRKIVTNGGISGSAANGAADFYYDGWRVVEEHDGADAILRQYTYGNYLDEVWTLDNRAGVTVAQLNDGSGGQRHFYASNTLYHVYGLTDETGALKEAYQYDAYGKHTRITDGNDGDSVVNFSSNDARTVNPEPSTLNSPYQYTGQRFDPETGLHYYKNRYYSSGLGRFVSRDPVGLTSGPSLLAYVNDRPTRFNDASGLAPICCVEEFKFTEWTKQYGQNTVSAGFYVEAKFKNSGGECGKNCDCNCCEYRQYLAGFIRTANYWYEDWTYLTVDQGGGNVLQQHTFHEDQPHGGYGHRGTMRHDRPGLPEYTDNNCKYIDYDEPRLETIRAYGEVHFVFKLQIIDTCNNNDVKKQEFHVLDMKFGAEPNWSSRAVLPPVPGH